MLFKNPSVRILAHRGASANAPENTLPAFEEAVRQGADGVELDVMVCGTGEVVVCHDERLDRLAGVGLDIRRTSWRRLKQLDVGSHLGFAPARIPLLDHVIQGLPAEFLVNIELKCDTVDDGGLAESVAHYVARTGIADRVIVSSFNPLCLLRFAHANPSTRRGFLIDPDKRFAWQNLLATPVTANFSVHPHFSACTPERVRQWIGRGLAVAAWTVDDAAEAHRLCELGVSYCITNKPGALRRELERIR